MFENAQLAALNAIIQTGSFEAAASRLGLTQSAVSQRVRALENTFGSPVVERTSPVRPTKLGARLAAHADTLDRLNGELARELGRDQELRIGIAVNADSVDTWFLPALAGILLVQTVAGSPPPGTVQINHTAYWATQPTGPDFSGVQLTPFAARNPETAVYAATQRQNRFHLNPANIPDNIQTQMKL